MKIKKIVLKKSVFLQPKIIIKFINKNKVQLC